MGKWVTSPESLSLITWAPNHFSLYSGTVRTSLPVGILSRLVSSLAAAADQFSIECFVLFSTWCLPCVYNSFELYTYLPNKCVCVLCLLDYYYFFVSCGLPATGTLLQLTCVVVFSKCHVNFLQCCTLLSHGTLY